MLFTWYLLPQKSVKRSRCSDTKKTICKQNIWQDRTEIITYINTFLSGRESVSFVYICIAVGGLVIKRVGLWSSYQEGRVVIQLSRGEGCDPVIKRVGLWSSYQEGRVVIQLSRGEGWDPINRFNPATLLYLSQANIWISNITCRGFLCVQWIKTRGDCLFCWYWGN